MTWQVDTEGIRWKRFTGTEKIRAYQPNSRWQAKLVLLAVHPITGELLGWPLQWWIKETQLEE